MPSPGKIRIEDSGWLAKGWLTLYSLHTKGSSWVSAFPWGVNLTSRKREVAYQLLI